MYIRHLLLPFSDWIENRLLQLAQETGYEFITPSMNRLFARMGEKPLGISELARQLAISRQAVHKLAVEAAALGLIEFIESDTNGRIKLLTFTSRGREVMSAADVGLEIIESELTELLGEPDVALLRGLLTRANRAIDQR